MVAFEYGSELVAGASEFVADEFAARTGFAGRKWKPLIALRTFLRWRFYAFS